MLKVVEQLNAVVGGIDGKVVRMQIRNISHARYAELDHRILRDFRARALNLSIEIEAVSAQRSTNTKNKGGRRGLLEQLHEFIVDADGELALNDKRWASLLEYWERTLVEEERSAAVANAKRGQL